MELQLTHEHFMKMALREALKALDDDEVPIGAVIACNGLIIGRGYNQTERLRDVTAHAEMIAITAASDYLGSKYLQDCTLYVTLEPCLMCASALRWAQIGQIVFGAYDDKGGFSRVKDTKVLHPKTQLLGGIMETECSAVLSDFFRARRS